MTPSVNKKNRCYFITQLINVITNKAHVTIESPLNIIKKTGFAIGRAFHRSVSMNYIFFKFDNLVRCRECDKMEICLQKGTINNNNNP